MRSLLIYYGNPWRNKQLVRFYCQFIQPGDLCFDIGAHVGNRIWAWSRIGATVVGVEPQPALMRWLQRFFGRSAHVSLRQEAVGAEIGRAMMFVSSKNPTVTTLSQEWLSAVKQDPSFASVSWETAVTTPVTTLDQLIKEYGMPVFCKIDVEGFELEVLQGLSQPIQTLSFEYIAAATEIAHACVDRLQTLGVYEFNWSPGEKQQLQFSTWRTASEIHTQINHFAGKTGQSGDIYARLYQG